MLWAKSCYTKYSAVYHQQRWALFFPLPQQKRGLYCKNSKIGDVLAVCGEDSIKCQIEELNNKSLAKDVVDNGKSIIVNDTDKSELFFKPKAVEPSRLWLCQYLMEMNYYWLYASRLRTRTASKRKELQNTNKL